MHAPSWTDEGEGRVPELNHFRAVAFSVTTLTRTQRENVLFDLTMAGLL